MIIIGMDIATRSGFAVMDGDKLLHAEAFRPSGKDDPEIFHGFRSHLRSLLIAHGVTVAAIEEPLRSDLTRREKDGRSVPISNMQTFLRLYGLRAHALEVCYSLNVNCHEVNQKSWRKAFLGNGKADKDAAMAQCKLMKWEVPNKDAAEACGVAFWLGVQLRLHQRGLPGELFGERAA